MDKLRVLTVSDQPWPDFIGGSHRVIHETTRRLARAGHEVTVLGRRRRLDVPLEETAEGVRLLRYEETPGIRAWRAASLPASVYRDRLRGRRFDLVHVHIPVPESLSLASRLGVPMVFTYHGPLGRESLSNGLGTRASSGVRAALPMFLYGAFRHNRTERRYLQRAAKVLVLSEHSRRELRELHGVPDAKILTIPGGVDADRFRPAPAGKRALRRRLGLPPDRRVLLTVRRLAPRMGLEALIEAVARLKDRRALLVICGTGPLQDALLRRITSERLHERVWLTGGVPEDRLPDFYRAADLFVLPSLELENFGLATLEALASGLPVLGTPVGGTVEILKPLDPALLFEDSSPAAMAAGVDRWLGRPARLASVAGRARGYALANYCWDRMAERTLEAYRELLR